MPFGRDTVLKQADQPIALFLCPLTSVKYFICCHRKQCTRYYFLLFAQIGCAVVQFYFNVHVEDKQKHEPR